MRFQSSTSALAACFKTVAVEEIEKQGFEGLIITCILEEANIFWGSFILGNVKSLEGSL